MKVVIDNSGIKITDADGYTRDKLEVALAYKDKSKEYQLRRMEKSPFTRKSAAYFKLKQEVYGTLFHEENEVIEIPSGFAYMFDTATAVDNRCDTGEEISLPWKDKPFDLRPYQKEAVDLMTNNWRGLINFATGLGKTLTSVYAIRAIKRKTLVLCPNISIADNFYEELCSAFGENKVGYFGKGKSKIKDITVGIAQSVVNNIDKFKQADLGLIISDECHHIPASTFFSITSELSHVGRIYGLTATDFRSDGKDILITAGVGPVIIKRDLVWGIKNGYLAKPLIIVREVETSGREFSENKLKNYKEHVLNSTEMNDRIVSDCQKFIKAGMSLLCLVDEVSHGQMIAEKLGIPLATGSDKQSSSYVKQLNEGKIPGLVGTDSKIGEGTDTKNVDVLVLANFVASKGILWQNLGRGLRVHNGNDKVIVLDYIPLGSKMLTRHAKQRIRYYDEITNQVEIRQ